MGNRRYPNAQGCIDRKATVLEAGLSVFREAADDALIAWIIAEIKLFTQYGLLLQQTIDA